MKDSIIDQFKEIFKQSQNWLKLEIEYMKLTTAEKFTILLSTITLGAICLLIATVILLVLILALVDVFKLFLTPALAHLSVAAILLLLILILYLLRKPLLLNPIARFITKLFFDKSK